MPAIGRVAPGRGVPVGAYTAEIRNLFRRGVSKRAIAKRLGISRTFSPVALLNLSVQFCPFRGRTPIWGYRRDAAIRPNEGKSCSCRISVFSLALALL